MQSIRRLSLALALALSAAKLSAAQMTPLAVEELARGADLIAHGTVTSKTCQRNPDGRIVTHVQLDVTEVWKGRLNTNSITIIHGGGTVGNRRVEVSGQVEYSVGEEVVAFLVLNPRGEPVTLGLAQGKFHVWQDQATGEKFVHNLFHGVTEKDAARDGKQAAKLALKELSQRTRGGAR